jgi:hypothetical protein
MRAASLRLDGDVRDRLSSTPVPAVWIEAWDHDGHVKEVLASAITGREGKFELAFDPAVVEKAFAGRPPLVTLKAFYKGARLAYAPAEAIDLSHRPTPLALTVTLPAAYGGDNLYRHLPPDLRAELEALKKHGPAVLSKLDDDKVKAAFLQDPARALADMGVPLSARLRQRLSSELPPKSVLTPRAFRLLNGQIVTPKVTIRFTPGKE